jgi:hypothetical protein
MIRTVREVRAKSRNGGNTSSRTRTNSSKSFEEFQTVRTFQTNSNDTTNNNQQTACPANGTNEVIRPLISSVLTTCAVFIPLIFMKGMAGALFFDQAVAVAIGLVVSLIVSITCFPPYTGCFTATAKRTGEPERKASPLFSLVRIGAEVCIAPAGCYHSHYLFPCCSGSRIVVYASCIAVPGGQSR